MNSFVCLFFYLHAGCFDLLSDLIWVLSYYSEKIPAGDEIATGKKMNNDFSNQTGCHKLEFLNILNAPTPFFLVTWLSTDFTDAHHQYPCLCVCGGMYSDIGIYT